MRATRALAIGTAWAFAAACATEDPTLAVQLRTDLAPGVEFIAVRTEVFPSLPVAAGESPSARAEIAAYRDSDLATGARVAELDVSAGAQTVRVTLLDSDRREVISTLSRVDVSGTTIVTVVITRDCREVMCPAAGDSAAAIACLGGRCVDPRCSVERPELCGTSECAADVDCVPTNACAAGRCELGSCLFVDADRCGPDQWCDPALGCRAIEGPSPDGGERDAGRRDAGPGPPDTGPGDSGPATPCGDGVRSGAEECDDGNRVSSDGCTAECAVERSPTCADGIVDHATFEECDDGDSTSGDGCADVCRIERGPRCGNGTLDLGDGEECDDGNLVSGDGCNGACQLEGGSGADCGNGAIGPAEICDDGNTTNGDACNPTCNFANTTSLVAGSPGMSGWVDGTGTAARFDSGLSLTLGSDAIYATASGGFRILRLDPATGDVRRIAGTGTMGSFDSTNGLSATFNSPWGLATDGVTLWVADGQTIRAIGPPPGRAVSTVAGTMVTRGCTDGIGAGATMSDARAPVWYRGRVYFVDATCATLRTFDPVTREVRTIAGAPMTSGSVDGSGGAVRFVSPRFMVSDGSGTLFIADTNGGRIRTYHTGADVVRTLAGSAPGYLDGAVATAQIHRPRGLTSDGTSIYFTEFNVHTVRQIDLRRGRVSTMIGTECACTPMCCAGGYAEGVGASAQLSGPWDVLFHPPTRSLYVFDGGNFVLRRVR